MNKKISKMLHRILRGIALNGMILSSLFASDECVIGQDLDEARDLEKETVAFLKTHQPASDRGHVSDEYIVDNVRLALKAWRFLQQQGLGKQVPWELFLNDVAPYAVFTEPRSDWRRLFVEKLLDPLLRENLRVKINPVASKEKMDGEASLRDLILRINRVAYSSFDTRTPIRFIAAPSCQVNNYAIPDVLKGTFTNGQPGSSCTGLAIFMTSCLRSVGIPARAVGTPHWNRDKRACPLGDRSDACGNHNWVEVWNGTHWEFLSPGDGAGPGSGWFFPSPADFQVPETLNHSIYATSWKPQLHRRGLDVPVDHFPMVWSYDGQDLWNNREIKAWDVTCRYLPEPLQERYACRGTEEQENVMAPPLLDKNYTYDVESGSEAIVYDYI